MNQAVLLLVVFIEGFASLGIEVVALRRLVPHVGSAITVTAPTIALFLAALALGYHTGGRVSGHFLARVLRNFLLAAAIAGIGLSGTVVQAIFTAAGLLPGYLLFMLLVVCPPAWLLAQTVPMLTNLFMHEDGHGHGRTGAASGAALTASTIGSVTSAAVLSLLVMQLLGVSAAVLLCCASLCLGVAVAAQGPGHAVRVTGAAALLAVLAWINLAPRVNLLETAYADYRVDTQAPPELPAGHVAPGRVFIVNGQYASRLDAGEPPRRSLYIERIQHLIVDELRFKDKQVLVLGAGGFTLSVGDPANRYTYVDIDPAIRAVAERHFLRGPIDGEFIADDARHFVAHTPRRFDAVVVDVYSAHASIPAHLVTLEFWRSLPRVLAPDGVVVINLILDGRLQSAFARNVLATIEHGLGRCAVEVLDRGRPVSNVVVSCRPGAGPGGVAAAVYTDERNRVDLDRDIRGY